MLQSVIDQMPTVPTEVPGDDWSYIPPEDVDTHRMLSATALKIARIDEPLYFHEWYDEDEQGHHWGYLKAFYHNDHVIKWGEIREALHYDYLTNGLRWYEPRTLWVGSLGMEAQSLRISFIPTVRR